MHVTGRVATHILKPHTNSFKYTKADRHANKIKWIESGRAVQCVQSVTGIFFPLLLLSKY